MMSLSKYFLWVLAVSCLALGNVGVALSHEDEGHSAQKTHKLSAQGQRVVEVLKNYAAAVQSGDLSEVEKYVVLDEGFSSLEDTFEDKGWKSYRHHLASELPMLTDMKYSFDNIRPYVKRKMAYATMDFALKALVQSDKADGGTKPITMQGKATIILVSVDNGWKIRHIHTVRAKAKKGSSEK